MAVVSSSTWDTSRVVTPSTSSDRAGGLPSDDLGLFPPSLAGAGYTRRTHCCEGSPPTFVPSLGGVWGPKRGSLEGQRAGETKQGLSPSPAPQHARPKAMGSVTFLGEALGRVKGSRTRPNPVPGTLRKESVATESTAENALSRDT